MKNSEIPGSQPITDEIAPSHPDLPVRILLVDDDNATRQLSLNVLARAGYDVDVAKDGVAGWKALQTGSYALVITDNKMPKMTGLEMIENLRAAGRSIPVIMATGLFPSHELVLKPWLKPDATLQRPFSNQALLEAVTKSLLPQASNGARNMAQTEQALRASELSYRRLFEAAKDGILILEVNTGRITDVNPFLIKLLGFSHAEMIGKTVGELSPFKDIEENQVMLERLQQDGYVRYEDLPLETRDGRHIAVEFVSNVYQAGDRDVIQCNVRDITERKLAELASIRLTALVEYSDDAIIGKGLDSIISSWNRGAEKLFGYSASEMVGTSIVRLIPADRQDEENQILAKLKRGESVKHFETLRQTKDGRLINVSVTASPIKDANGKVIGVSKVARDITERKHAEELIHQLNAELEHRVTQRTAQLQASNQELEAFSYSVSHDLRAPLRHVLGFVELLQKDAGPSLSNKNQTYLTTISEAAKRMGELIDDLLAFSRIGRSEMQKAEINLDKLAHEIANSFKEETKDRTIEWNIHPLPLVRADRPLLRQVMLNLISNAVKFTGKRTSARIEIGCTAGAPTETVIFIRDNGAGFDPLFADKLFGVFQRLHRHDEFEGTGIGLANVQRIIQRHGGRVWAEGAVNDGATFYFSLPKQNGGRNAG